jgi:molybdate transport system substrate-binding protein
MQSMACMVMDVLVILCGTEILHAQDFSGPKVADAKSGDVRVLATAAIRQPLDKVRNQAQQVVGHPLVIEYGSARGNLKQEILAGQNFEVALLLPDVNAELLKADKILPDSFEIARDPVGVGLRGEAPNLDVSTPESLKQAMLHARSVRYAPTGAALDTVKKILGTLGIANAINDSSSLQQPVALGPGEYEINLFPVSEIIPNKALINLGPVTPSLQVPVVITAVVGKHAGDMQAARSLIKFLQGRAVAVALTEDGMEAGRPGE